MTDRRPIVIEAVEPVNVDPMSVTVTETRAVSLGMQLWRRFRRDALAIVGLVVMAGVLLIAIVGPQFVTADPNKIDYTAINALPSEKHPLGTDNLGRDTLARLIYGLRVSLLVAAYVELLDIVLGVPLGLAAGYFGGKVDFVITRIADVLFAFPGLLLAILVTAIFGAAVTDQFGGTGPAGAGGGGAQPGFLAVDDPAGALADAGGAGAGLHHGGRVAGGEPVTDSVATHRAAAAWTRHYHRDPQRLGGGDQ